MSRDYAELVYAVIVLLATAWAAVLGRVFLGKEVGRSLFAAGIVSTVLWASLVGLGLCEFTNAHAVVSGVI